MDSYLILHILAPPPTSYEHDFSGGTTLCGWPTFLCLTVLEKYWNLVLSSHCESRLKYLCTKVINYVTNI